MSLKIEAKQAVVAEVSAVAATAQSAIAAVYRGLTVAQMTQLRAAARKSGVYVKVVKNTLARRAIEGNPNFTPGYRVLAAALAHLDRIEEARSVAQRLLELMPDFNVEIEKFIFRRSGRLALFLDGMRTAGLPA